MHYCIIRAFLLFGAMKAARLASIFENKDRLCNGISKISFRCKSSNAGLIYKDKETNSFCQCFGLSMSCCSSDAVQKLPIKQAGDVTEKAESCNLSQNIIQEIQSYQPIANGIMNAFVSGPLKGKTFNDLADLTDQFGSRQVGTKNLEDAIDYMLNKLVKNGIENVHGEEVQVPHWVRGTEIATLISPTKPRNIAIKGLGTSIGTPKGGITADVIVVDSFDELISRGREQIEGKIVVFNQKFISYEKTIEYRIHGARIAAECGASATLIRSLTDLPAYQPHTGFQVYGTKPIPTACLTIEDAEMLKRMQTRGQKITIHLVMEDRNLSPVISRNTIGEIVGREKPQEVVVVSGHLDSWDVGQGAEDDGGGAMISVKAVEAIKFLGLPRPRRNLRAILWTGEEIGGYGAIQYAKTHQNEMNQFSVLMESDSGTFTPLGIDYVQPNGLIYGDTAGCIVQEILQLLVPINATRFHRNLDDGEILDISEFKQQGLPLLSLKTKDDRYFWFHHSELDRMTVENSDELDLCAAVWTLTSYVLADLSIFMPRS